jgi:hypothetical protein
MAVNNQVLASLPTAPQTRVPAILTDRTGKILYRFLYAPETQKYFKEAKFTEVPTGGTWIQPQVYGYTTGRTQTLNDLLIDTHCEGRSARELIEGLGILMNPDRESFKPTVVYFIFGSSSFGPAYIKTLDWEEQGWLNGEFALGRISLTLIEIPGATTQTETNTNLAEPQPPPMPTYTARLKEEARTQADRWLTQNLNRLKPDIQQRVRTRSFRFLTDDYGTVSMTDERGNILGRIGTWSGFVFTPTSDLLR